MNDRIPHTPIDPFTRQPFDNWDSADKQNSFQVEPFQVEQESKKSKRAALAGAAAVVGLGVVSFLAVNQGGEGESITETPVPAEVDAHDHSTHESVPAGNYSEESNDDVTVESEPQKTFNIFESTGNADDDKVIAWFESANNAPDVTVFNVPFLEPQTEQATSEIDDLFSNMEEATGSEIISSGTNAELEQKQTLREEIIQKLDTEFILAFEHPSGLKVNVHKSSLNGGAEIEVDPDAMATLLTHAITNTREANNGYLNEAELAIIDSALTSPVFEGKVMDVVFLGEQRDETDYCAEDFNIAPESTKTSPDCKVAGFMTYDGPDGREAAREAELMVVQLGVDYRPSVDVNVASSDALDEAGQAYAEVSVIETLEHEFAHHLATLSGAKQRLFTEADGVAREQASVAGSLDYELYENLRSENVQKIVHAEHENYVDAVGEKAGDAQSIKLREIKLEIDGTAYTTEVPVPLFLELPVDIAD